MHKYIQEDEPPVSFSAGRNGSRDGAALPLNQLLDPQHYSVPSDGA